MSSMTPAPAMEQLSALEAVPLLVVNRILQFLPPLSLPPLLLASRTVRIKFSLDDNERQFAFEHLRFHCRHAMPDKPLVLNGMTRMRMNPWHNLPFRELPDVYAVACLVRTWTQFHCEQKSCCGNLSSLWVVIPDINKDMELLYPHRPLKWVERVMMKAAHLIELRTPYQVQIALQIANALDSVPMMEIIFERLYPSASRVKNGPKGVQMWTASMNDERDHGLTLADVDFAWWIANAAFRAAGTGSLQALEFTLHHPDQPAAYTLTNGQRTLLHFACDQGRLDVVDYLIGNPLPLRPRPGAPTRSTDSPPKPNKLWPLPNHSPCRFTRRNPAATLFDPNRVGHPPMEDVVMRYKGDPAPAIDHLVSRGASVNPSPLDLCPCGAGPLQWAADPDDMETNLAAIKHLVARGAGVSANIRIHWKGKGCGVLHILAECMRKGTDECVKVLLQNGANRDLEDTEGRTPLEYARLARNIEVMRVLVKNGARVTVTKGSGRMEMRIGKDLLAWFMR
ncbi:hypothetical protein HDU96_008587 [Phlyctochytrium bullatum]|nr:hypothetical protein HDU96_008587 [Phlyctochytrium bullatum]